MTKKEFLLTKSLQYQTDKWREYEKISAWGLSVDSIPNS